MEAFGEDLFSVFEENNNTNNNNSPNKSNKRKYEPPEEEVEEVRQVRPRKKEEPKTLFQQLRKIEKIATVSPPSSSFQQAQLQTQLTASTINEEMLETQSETKEIISCQHDVCLPPSIPGKKQWDLLPEMVDPPFPENPTKTWPFTLDSFQKMSIACIEREESVLVSAHTSAGKTVVAEYAIAKSLKAHQRVIYTSPIKALSNQKYRELYESYQDVGLMTGDITINPNASCLVMTTEILRSMLYRGSEVMREVAWVIFDEIHYMRDKERGVVWEETIILLPDKVRYVFLSATIPNAKEFASWIAKIHEQPCHVVYTEMRPIPLQHYIFPAGGEGLHLVVDEKGVFREDNFQKALSQIGPGVISRASARGDKKKKGGTSGPSDCYKIVKMIMERNYQPVIVFSFSKKECEALALQMAKLDLNDDEEKKLVERVFSNAIDSLNDDDKKLPQVLNILPLLKRGIGIHHSGLLPILKEVIEILFQEGLLKALFATETFSIGLNMPAKTCVFTSVRKFDGDSFRWISSGEYIQMSGRAGRRGLDDRGIVILMIDEKMEPSVAKNMVKGSADPLYSSFHIGYNMLLNLLRVEDIDPEFMLRRSFHQFQHERGIPKAELRLGELTKERDEIILDNEESLAEYHSLKEQIKKLNSFIQEIITQPIHCLPYLQPGRLVKVTDGSFEYGWGVVVNFQKKQGKGINQTNDNLTSQYIIDVLLNCDPNSNSPAPCPPNETPIFQIVPITMNLLENISSIRIYIPKDLKNQESRLSVQKILKESMKRFPDGIPVLDPIEDMKIDDPSLKKTITRLELLENRLQANKFFQLGAPIDIYEQYCRKLSIMEEIKTLEKLIQKGDEVILKQELKCMKRVLRRLGYTNSEDIIELKGRVACEINAADELLLTELIFGGVFNEMDVEHIVALLSCFVFQEKVDSTQKLREDLAAPYRQLQEYARKIARVSQESKLSIDVEEYVQSFSPYLMEVVYSWCKGAKFSEICSMTDIFEGSIIRCMKNLEELLRQLSSAAKGIGNSLLENKFAEGINKLKRDIVFAASLYL